MFSNVLLVEDYNIALIIASQGFTCITSELQVVYPGAFITKVGSQGRIAINAAQAQSRLSLYQKIQELTKSYVQQLNQVSQMIEAKAELNQNDLNANIKMQKCEVRLNQHKQAISELKFANLQLVGQLQSRQAKEQEYQAQVAKYEQRI